MSNELTEKYNNALEAFLEKVKKDKYIIAVILAGSLYHDIVWEKSDIDIILITDDSKKPVAFYCLVENGIIINISSYSSNEFRRQFESSLTGGLFHSWINKTKLLYTLDESITDIYGLVSAADENDRELLLFEYGTYCVAELVKAERYLYIKHDPLYSAFDMCKDLLYKLSGVEVILNGGIVEKEVIHQALKINPDFFNHIYTGMLQQYKDERLMSEIIISIDKYLEERTPVLFKGALDFLQNENKVCSITEIERKVGILSLPKALLIESFEWLVRKKFIDRFSSPLRLTSKSWVEVDEAAYFYGG